VTVAADPEALRLVLPATSDLGDRVGRAAHEVSDALARVQATCIDHRPAVGPVDHELRALVARWRAAGDATARFADELAGADSGSVLGDLLREAGAAGRAVAERMRTDPDLAGRMQDVLDGDPTPDDIDALIDWLQELDGEAGTVVALRTFAVDLGRLMAEAGAPESALTRWAMRGSRLGLSRWAMAGAAYSLMADGRGLVDAFTDHRSGAHKAVVISRTAFDVSSLSCAVAPSVPTCGAAVVTGVAWGAAEVYEHREGVRQAVDLTGQLVRSRARDLRQAVERRLAAGGERFADLLDVVLTPAPTGVPIIPIAPGLGPLLEGADDAGRGMAGAGRRLIDEGPGYVGDRLEAGGRALTDGAGQVGSALVGGLRRLPGIG